MSDAVPEIDNRFVYNLDYNLAKLLISAFERYKEQAGTSPPKGVSEREWEAIVEEIYLGFYTYVETYDKIWGYKEVAPDDQRMHDIAMRRVRKSFTLLSKYYPNFWY